MTIVSYCKGDCSGLQLVTSRIKRKQDKLIQVDI